MPKASRGEYKPTVLSYIVLALFVALVVLAYIWLADVIFPQSLIINPR